MYGEARSTYIAGDDIDAAIYRKVTFFMDVTNLCESVKTGLLINLCDFICVLYSILCIVMHCTIKIHAVQIYATGA